MKNVEEVLRLPSPAPRPQALAFDGEHLWMGSLETERLYAIDPRAWTVREEAEAPGKPYGATVVGDELRVLCGETANPQALLFPLPVAEPEGPPVDAAAALCELAARNWVTAPAVSPKA